MFIEGPDVSSEVQHQFDEICLQNLKKHNLYYVQSNKSVIAQVTHMRHKPEVGLLTFKKNLKFFK